MPKKILTVSDYAADARARATAAGAPLNRSAFPGLQLTPTRYLHVVSGHVHIAKRNGTDRRLSIEDVEEFVEHRTDRGADPLVWLCADRSTRSKLIATAKRFSAEAERPYSRQLTPLTTLSASRRLPVLTDALAYTWWAPEAVDTDSLASWAAAFGVSSSSRIAMMRALEDKAVVRSAPPALLEKQAKDARALALKENWMVNQFRYKGESSDVSSYSLLDAHASVSGAIAAMDPGLFEMHMLNGTVSAMTVQDCDRQLLAGPASSPFKHKVKRTVRVITNDGVGQATVTSIDVDDDGLYVSMEAAYLTKNSEGFIGLDEETVYLTADVFDLPQRVATERRWLGEKRERVSRQMPTAVAAPIHLRPPLIPFASPASAPAAGAGLTAAGESVLRGRNLRTHTGHEHRTCCR
ncbi:hypothetical protein [Kocuria dechangensis]|nr:hypothetical protein [Kocuria dechangensis]